VVHLDKGQLVEDGMLDGATAEITLRGEGIQAASGTGIRQGGGA
jgi:hypothetical protein